MRGALDSLVVCILLFQGLSSQAEEIVGMTKAAVEVVDETPEMRFGDDLLSEWLKQIVLASGNYEIVSRQEAHFLMQGTLKKAERIIISGKPEVQIPAFQVQFELWFTEMDPKTLEPALLPEININRSIYRIYIVSTFEEAIKKAMKETFETIRGGIFDVHKKGISRFHNRLEFHYHYHILN